MKTGIELITEERDRQVSKEGWTPEHDDEHVYGELAAAAIVYASPFTSIRAKSMLSDDHVCDPWPDDWEYKPKSRIENLVRAGALIAAEIDRLQRSK